MSTFIILLVLYVVFCAVTGVFLAVLSQDIPHSPRTMANDTRPAPMATKDTFHA